MVEEGPTIASFPIVGFGKERPKICGLVDGDYLRVTSELSRFVRGHMIYNAVFQNDQNLVERLLDQELTEDLEHCLGTTLHLAVKKSSVSMVRLLHGKGGASIKHQDWEGRTALHHAIIRATAIPDSKLRKLKKHSKLGVRKQNQTIPLPPPPPPPPTSLLLTHKQKQVKLSLQPPFPPLPPLPPLPPTPLVPTDPDEPSSTAKIEIEQSRIEQNPLGTEPLPNTTSPPLPQRTASTIESSPPKPKKIYVDEIVDVPEIIDVPQVSEDSILEAKEVIRFLLEKGASGGVPDKSGRSAWDLADNEHWVQKLRKHRPFAKGPSNSLPKWQEPHPPDSKAAREACNNFIATIAEFYYDERGERRIIERPSIHGLLYTPSTGPHKILNDAKERNNKEIPICSWYHIPANNVCIQVRRMNYENSADTLMLNSRRSGFK